MKSLFIVEPDPVLAKAYETVLATINLEILTFRTAHLAVRALEKVIPDIVLLEIALPGHNGFEFLYELRSYHDTRDVRVVVNSFVQESDIPWGYVNRGELGIVEYLYKPITSLDMLKKSMISATEAVDAVT